MGTEAPARTGPKGIEEVVTFAFRNPIRAKILILLNESTYTAAELAAISGEPLSKLSNHVRHLLEAGSIEIAEIIPRRNFGQNVYRAVQIPFVSDEAMAAMSPYDRQMTYGLILQTLIAEIMASFWAGKMRDDPRAWVTSNWLHLDIEGRNAIADEQARSWNRLEEIETDSIARSGRHTTSYVVGQIGFERARTAPRVPRSEEPSRADVLNSLAFGGESGKSFEEVVTFAVSNQLRGEIVILLNEDRYTTAEIATVVEQPVNRVHNHLTSLLKAGLIEIAAVSGGCNIYRAVKSPYYSDEDMAAMTPGERQVTYGLVVETMIAEIMDSFWKGKIRDDPRAWVTSNWLNLDAQGRKEVRKEQTVSWNRLQEVGDEATERSGQSGGALTHCLVVGQLGFERARSAPKPPKSANDE